MISQRDLDLLEDYLSIQIPGWMEAYKEYVWVPFKEGYLDRNYKSLEYIQIYRRLETILDWDFNDLPLHMNDFPENPLNRLVLGFRLGAGI